MFDHLLLCNMLRGRSQRLLCSNDGVGSGILLSGPAGVAHANPGKWSRWSGKRKLGTIRIPTAPPATHTGLHVNQNACTQGSTASSSKFSVSAQIPAQPHAHRRFPSPTFICVVPQRTTVLAKRTSSQERSQERSKSAAKSGTAAGRKYEFSALPLAR